MSLTRSRTLHYVLLTVIGIGFILFIEYLGFFNGLNDYLYDLSFRIRGSLKHNQNIVIAAIDEKTLKHLGRWPLKRLYYARLLDAVKTAKAVGFDIIMAEPSQDDDFLNDAIKRHGRVILPVYVGESLQVSYPSATLSPYKIGHIHIEQGIDGVARTVFHRLRIHDDSFSSFSAALFESARYVALYQDGHANTTRSDAILQSNPMHINYYGPTGTFQHISFYDIIAGAYPLSYFTDKIVLVGITTPGLEARMLTPFTQERNRMSGVEVHAHILNTLFDQNDIRFVGTFMRWTISILLSILFFILFLRTDGRKAMLLWLGGIITLSVFIFTLFSSQDMWFGPAILYLNLSFVFIMTYILRLERMGKLLLHAKEEWEETFNTIDDAIIIHDQQFHIIRANKSASSLMQLPFYQKMKSDYIKIFQEHKPLKGNELLFNALRKGEVFITEVFEPSVNKFFEVKAIPQSGDSGEMLDVIHVIRDITERKQTEEAIRKNQEQLRNLAAYLQKVGETERTNIAREIHDELGQALTVLKMDLSLLRRKWPEDSTTLYERTEAMLTLIDKTIQSVKKISTELRPGLLDDLGLSAAIEWQSDEFQKRTGIRCTVTTDPPDITLDRERNTAIFRILQETLTNVARHAEATEVNILLQKNIDQIELRVVDNGKGITEEQLSNPTSFGLLGIRERVTIFGGTITIAGIHGKGTTVIVRIPAQDQES